MFNYILEICVRLKFYVGPVDLSLNLQQVERKIKHVLRIFLQTQT